MAKKAYVGVGGSSRNVKAIYVGVNGEPKKVIKGYVGVNGVPQLFWDSESEPFYAYYWSSTIGFDLLDDVGYYLHKTNGGIAYYAVVKDGNNYVPILMSPLAQGVDFDYEYNGTFISSRGYNGTLVDSNNITWYYACYSDVTLGYNSAPDYCMSCSVANAPQTLLNAIYTVPFVGEYQTGSSIYPVHRTDYVNALKRAVGIFLFLNYSSYNSDVAYTTLSDDFDTIFWWNMYDNLNLRGDRYLWTDITVNSSYLEFIVYTSTTWYTTLNVSAEITQDTYGYDYYIVGSGTRLTFNGYRARIDTTGNVTYSSASVLSNSHILGFRATTSLYPNYSVGAVRGYNLELNPVLYPT